MIEGSLVTDFEAIRVFNVFGYAEHDNHENKCIKFYPTRCHGVTKNSWGQIFIFWAKNYINRVRIKNGNPFYYFLTHCYTINTKIIEIKTENIY